MDVNDVTEQQLEEIEALFVQTAGGLTSEAGKAIILHDPSPSTIYFADRPSREVGHLATKLFIDLWDDGENSFAEDPPNAVLSFAEPGDRMPEEVIVMIANPELTQDSLRYDVTVLSGELPSTTGACALFIDPIGRPLSPMSVAGVHRRERRREMRRP
jgi:hypothetical protein